MKYKSVNQRCLDRKRGIESDQKDNVHSTIVEEGPRGDVAGVATTHTAVKKRHTGLEMEERCMKERYPHWHADLTLSAELLAMLGQKSICKDRCRQGMAEPERMEYKLLLPLDSSVSGAQTDEI